MSFLGKVGGEFLMSKAELRQEKQSDTVRTTEQRKAVIVRSYPASDFGAIGHLEAPLTFDEQSLEDTGQAVLGHDRP